MKGGSPLDSASSGIPSLVAGSSVAEAVSLLASVQVVSAKAEFSPTGAVKMGCFFHGLECHGKKDLIIFTMRQVSSW